MEDIPKEYKKAAVFGVFDNFHPGHEFFLNEAAKRCEKLVVVVTLPEIVLQLKNKEPKDSLDKRLENVKNLNNNFEVVPGDENLGEWSVLKDKDVEVVFLGHDQNEIAKELDKMNVKHIPVNAFYPEIYKSSIY